MSGSATIAVSAQATPYAVAHLLGSAAVSLSAQAIPTAVANLSGVAPITLGASGTASFTEPEPDGVMVGSAAINIGASATISAVAFMQGAASFSITAIDTLEVQTQQVTQPAYSQSSGGSGDGGTGYVLTEHGWVKLTKWVRSGAKTHESTQHAATQVDFGNAFATTKVQDFEACMATQATTTLVVTPTRSHTISYGLTFGVAFDLTTSVSRTHSASLEWLDGDELLALLEF